MKRVPPSVVGAGPAAPPAGGNRVEPKTVPGFVNAHTHLYSGLAGFGMPAPRVPPSRFVEILERLWWRLDRALDERALRAAARLYVAEALGLGTTTLIDHHESPHWIEGSLDVLADACQELGMRAVLCYGATERNRGREEAAQGLAECRRFLENNRRPLVAGMVGLHASFTVSDETVREAGALCQELGTALHVHVAEDRVDLDDARRRGYRDPWVRLHRLGALPAGSILAHGVWLDEEAVREVERAGCWLVQNPRSNEGNRVGYPRALHAGHRVALGTDGYPSDLRDELAALHRLARQDSAREPGGPESLARRPAAGVELAAERFGQGALGRDTVELESAAAGERPGIRRVSVDGRVVVEGGRLASGDLEEIRAHAREEAARLWRRMESLP